jgi:uncharacterized protein YndB with AHSA1/START domain
VDAELGRITATGETRALRFERRLEAGLDQVWAALTEPELIAGWLTDASVEPGAGGRVAFDFGENGVCRGEIAVWEPPRALEYGWVFPDGHASRVRWELEPVPGGGTRLTLVHELLRPLEATGYGAGWHAFLDRLAGRLAGSTPDWGERFEAVRPGYEAAAAALDRASQT